jgi:hypothetical protein
MRKGIELPMNTLVVVAIAVIILLAMTAFFISGFGPSSQRQVYYNKMLSYCQPWAAGGCEEIPSDKSSLLNYFCQWKYGSKYKYGKIENNEDIECCKDEDFTQCAMFTSSLKELKKVCGCPGFGYEEY